MIRTSWIDRLETHMDEEAERAAMEGRIAALEVKVADLTEWLTALSEDVEVWDADALL